MAALLLAGACASRGSADTSADLLASLQATTVGDSVDFHLQVTNPGSDPIALEFDTEPIQYFSVSRDGLPIWNSAPDLHRVDAVRVDTLQSGETRSFHASWAVPMGLRGTLTVIGVLRDRRRPVVQSTQFDIP